MTQRIWSSLPRFLPALVLLTLIIAFQNCGEIKQPGVDNLGSMKSFSHNPIPQNCTACHADSRPTGIVGTATFALSPVGGLFDHGLFPGTDCVKCHIANPANVGVTWEGGIWDHLPTPTTCISCHTPEQRPPGLIGNPQFDHATGGTADCVLCHAVQPANIGKTWATGKFNHNPQPTECATCHRSDPIYTGIQNTIKNQMSHTLVGLPDCVTCHATAAAASQFTSWLTENIPNGARTPRANLGVLHSNLPNTPNTCILCHINERPIGLTGTTGLVGNLTPTGGLFDHSSNGGTGDCVNCHTANQSNVGRTWAAGKFGHFPVPTSCLPCHNASQRPVGPVSTPPFDHGVAPNGTGDCVTCHASIPGNVGKTWSAGQFAHNPVPVACASCHTSDVVYTAIANTIKNQMNHNVAGLPDCVGCHRTAAQASAFSNWVNQSSPNGSYADRATLGNFHANFGATPPKGCTSCHANERPVGAVGTPPFDHATLGTGDCVTCHATPANIGRTWKGGKFGHSPLPTACNSCHANDSTYTAIKPIIRNQMNHTYFGLPDCVGCHRTAAASNNFTSWVAENVANGSATPRASLGVFHANIVGSPSTCILCHINERPVGLVGPVGGQFDHANGGTGDCNGCHGVAANVGKTWAGGLMAHSLTTPSCIGCHANKKPAGVVPNNRLGFNHDPAYGTECATCHKVVTANLGVRWSGGFFNHNNNNAASFKNCSPCHDTFEHKPGTNCTTCHKNIRWPVPSSTGKFGGSFGDG